MFFTYLAINHLHAEIKKNNAPKEFQRSFHIIMLPRITTACTKNIMSYLFYQESTLLCYILGEVIYRIYTTVMLRKLLERHAPYLILHMSCLQEAITFKNLIHHSGHKSINHNIAEQLQELLTQQNVWHGEETENTGLQWRRGSKDTNEN